MDDLVFSFRETGRVHVLLTLNKARILHSFESQVGDHEISSDCPCMPTMFPEPDFGFAVAYWHWVSDEERQMNNHE